MRKPEQQLWETLRAIMFFRWDAQRIEDSLSLGVPDVTFAVPGLGDGWMELKVLDAWPKRDDTNVKIPHFTAEQKKWLARRWKSGGKVYTLVHVEGTKPEYFLFAGENSFTFEGHPRRDWYALSAGNWSPRMEHQSFLGALKGTNA